MVVRSGKSFDHDGGPNIRCVSTADFARTHIYRCTGSVGLGSTTANHIFASLKDAAGTWTEHFTTDTAGSRARVYIGGDRTEKQAAEARLGKNMLSQLKKRYPQASIVFRKHSGEILAGWIPNVKNSIPIKGEPHLECNPDAVAASDFDEDRIKECFRAATSESGSSPANIRWASLV